LVIIKNVRKDACSRIVQRSVINLLVAEGCKAVEIRRRMSIVYGDTCFSRKNIYKWAKLLGQRSVENEDRPGKHTKVRLPKVIKSVNDLIKSNRRVTVDDIAWTLAYLTGQHTKLSMMNLTPPKSTADGCQRCLLQSTNRGRWRKCCERLAETSFQNIFMLRE